MRGRFRDHEARALQRLDLALGAAGPARSAIETTTWSPGGRLQVRRDATGRETRYGYDTAGRSVREHAQTFRDEGLEMTDIRLSV